MLENLAPLLLLALPAAATVVVATASRSAFGLATARVATFAAMLGVLALALWMFGLFDSAGSAPRFDYHTPWLAGLGVDFHFGVDGFNLYLVLLTAVLFPVVLACTWSNPRTQRPLFLGLVLVLEAALLGTFLAQNLILFFAFWEAVLIPMGILILVFGGERRRDAAVSFFMYTLAGSVLLLAAVIALGAEAFRQNGAWSFELDLLLRLQLDWSFQVFVFVAIMLAAAVKCPLVPFHSWLPLAYYEAPASGTALMAGALSKMGAFAMLRLAVPFAPDVAAVAAPYVVLVAVMSIVYGAVLALRQEDPKKLVAYSSLSHMGYIVLGIFSFQDSALHGAMLQILSHAMSVTGLFLLLGMLEERYGAAYRGLGGLSSVAPRFAVLFMLFVLASLALPLTSGFTAEFLILLGAFTQGLAAWHAQAGSLLLVLAIVATTGMVLGAAYMLRLARALLFGDASSSRGVQDVSLRAVAPLALPLVFIVWIGVAPAGFMSKVEGALAEVTDAVRATPVSSSSSPAVVLGSLHGK